ATSTCQCQQAVAIPPISCRSRRLGRFVVERPPPPAGGGSLPTRGTGNAVQEPDPAPGSITGPLTAMSLMGSPFQVGARCDRQSKDRARGAGPTLHDDALPPSEQALAGVGPPTWAGGDRCQPPLHGGAPVSVPQPVRARSRGLLLGDSLRQ